MLLVLLPVYQLLVPRIAHLVEVYGLGAPVLLRWLLFVFSWQVRSPPAPTVAIDISRAMISGLVPWVLTLSKSSPLTRYLPAISLQGLARPSTALRELPSIAHVFAILLLPRGQLQGVHLFLQVLPLLTFRILATVFVLDVQIKVVLEAEKRCQLVKRGDGGKQKLRNDLPFIEKEQGR